MTATAQPWVRPYHVSPGRPGLHLFFVFGAFDEPLQLPVKEGHCPRGVDGLDVRVMSSARERYWLTEPLLAKLLASHPDGLRDVAASAPKVVALRRECPDTNDLLDLRCTVAVVSSLLGWGGVAVLDPLALRWWSRAEWARRFVEVDRFDVEDHARVVMTTDRAFATRGMRKFGRADVRIRDVAPDRLQPAAELLVRFAEYQALGGELDPARPLEAEGFPSMSLEPHLEPEDLDAPDFNNVWFDVIGFR